jgi:tRNA A37 threonylcarbamoyladenosine synthetase subunit TsaC/SUA5/YrdC
VAARASWELRACLAGTMLDLYGNRGIDFVVDVGRRVATESTVIDMTSAVAEVLREGAGDASLFL